MTERPKETTITIFNPQTKLSVGDVFKEWPLHITLVPPFTLGKTDLDQVRSAVIKSTQNLNPIEFKLGQMRAGSIPLEIGEFAIFGDQTEIDKTGGVPVTLVNDITGELKLLHNSLIAGLQEAGCNLPYLEYAQDNYNPHTSHKSNETVGEPFLMKRLASGAKIPEVGKKVLDLITLFGPNQ